MFPIYTRMNRRGSYPVAAHFHPIEAAHKIRCCTHRSDRTRRGSQRPVSLAAPSKCLNESTIRAFGFQTHFSQRSKYCFVLFLLDFSEPYYFVIVIGFVGCLAHGCL